MDPAQNTPVTPTPIPTPAVDPNNELAHVTQEMYKKNAELAHTNKTLSILRKIDEIILSTVTDIGEIAQKVANVVTLQAEFKRVSILILDKDNSLVRVAISDTPSIRQAETAVNIFLKGTKISMNNDQNFVVKSIKERRLLTAHEFADVLSPDVTRENAKIMEGIIGIKSTLIYPILVRGGVIGAMVISISQSEDAVNPYEKDLIDRLAGVIGIAIDNALLYQKIQEANQKLKELDKLKDEFVSLASHELRTPMTAIKSYLWMALAGKGGVLSEKQKYYLERSYNATDRLIKLVNDMLNVSRIESGRISIDIKPLDLPKVIIDVITEVTPRAQEFGLQVTYTPNPLPQVLADTDKLKEILINLIGNSLKFTPPGGQVNVVASQNNNIVVVEVRDNGKGIKAEDLPKLFQKFATIGTAYLTKQNTQGTGLGLYISKSLVEKQGGRMWLHSDGENKGTSFYFSLPIATQPATL